MNYQIERGHDQEITAIIIEPGGLTIRVPWPYQATPRQILASAGAHFEAAAAYGRQALATDSSDGETGYRLLQQAEITQAMGSALFYIARALQAQIAAGSELEEEIENAIEKTNALHLIIGWGAE